MNWDIDRYFDADEDYHLKEKAISENCMPGVIIKSHDGIIIKSHDDIIPEGQMNPHHASEKHTHMWNEPNFLSHCEQHVFDFGTILSVDITSDIKRTWLYIIFNDSKNNQQRKWIPADNVIVTQRNDMK